MPCRPYLLPCAAVTLISGASLLSCIFFVRETLPRLASGRCAACALAPGMTLLLPGHTAGC